MKKTIISIVALMIIGLGLHAQGQSAETLAQRMKDSLSLTDQQKNQVLNVNKTLVDKQTMMRQMFAGTSSLPYYLQRVETNRDSLYKAILPNDKYVLYMTKRGNIITGN